MEWLIGPDLPRMFSIDTPLLEIVLRGSIMYLGIFILLRLILRREAGMLSVPDILMVVLLADAAQNGMADNYQSVVDGMLLVMVILVWNWILDRLAFHFRIVEWLVHPGPLILVENGKLIGANLRKEFISQEELWSQLREQGVEDLKEIRKAFLEANGRITVIRAGAKGENCSRGRRMQ
ncbi:MAG: DUF421 domain-containing protein [Syntrophotaleaceae bacterium]